MEVVLKYGRGELAFDLPDRNVLGVLSPRSVLPPLTDLPQAVEAVLASPTAGPSLAFVVEELKPRSVAVIVNDMTRSTPTDLLLPPVLRELERLKIPRQAVTIVVATGTHRPMTEEELLKMLGPDIMSAYRVENHDCEATDLVDRGLLSTGNRLWVNKTVSDAELRIAIGEVLLHYYAGFAGGRKSILPGVAGRETVMRNHAMMTAPGVGIGLLEGNRLYAETDEAAEKLCRLHFIVNIVSDCYKNVVRVVGGHFRDAWREGVKTFEAMNFVKIPQKADAVFISAGGYPKDINMYQAHKAVYMGSRAVKTGGTMAFFAELEEGYGHRVFAEWAERDRTPDQVTADFEARFLFGAHKLYYLASHAKEFQILLHSAMGERESRRMFCAPSPSVEKAKEILAERHGPNFTAWVIPQGGIVLPVVEP